QASRYRDNRRPAIASLRASSPAARDPPGCRATGWNRARGAGRAPGPPRRRAGPEMTGQSESGPEARLSNGTSCSYPHYGGRGYGSLSVQLRANSVANTLIHENRRLQFPLDTLVDALIELEDKQGHWPSKATVVGASIDNSNDNAAAVVLSIHRSEGGAVVERRYSLSMVAAAIVNYCVTMRVPMPRNSTKSIQVLPDGVILLLENTVMLHSRHEELSTLAAGSVKPVSPAPAEKPEAAEGPAPRSASTQAEGPSDGPAEVPAEGPTEGPGAGPAEGAAK